MLEITGNIFDQNSWSRKPITPEIALCVTTNGVVKASGQAVMGAGMAKDFTLVYPQLPVILGQKLACCGNQVHYLLTDDNVHILSFPTKHHWRDSSNLALIENSAKTLAELAVIRPDCTFVLTEPGCGLGGLSWSVVRNSIATILPDNCWS
ncbi:MAG: hypothetical protein HC939_16435 [Pleurocapsa sp. SU_5_0]|nr:hypothetical protein [Pleurocapsa sp. SU_5_0]